MKDISFRKVKCNLSGPAVSSYQAMNFVIQIALMLVAVSPYQASPFDSHKIRLLGKSLIPLIKNIERRLFV